MKPSRKRPPDQLKAARRRPHWPLVALLSLLITAAAVGIGWRLLGARFPSSYHPRPKGTLTYTKDIAPLMLEHCAGCHRPGQSGPFNLLTYEDVRHHAQQIVEVTRRHYMPPWLPEPGYCRFEHERRLTNEIGILEQWFKEGTIVGASSDLPPTPHWSDQWQLGQPDLVLTMPRPYVLGAEGRDVYRNFVIPVPLSGAKFIRAVELAPGNRKILHHAFIKVDPTPQSRRLEQREKEPGFPGMDTPAEMPDGHFLSWQPGKVAAELPAGLAWRLHPGSDLVLQTHLNPSGKPELFQASVALYFTDQPPTNVCLKCVLASLSLDIPAGTKDFVVEDSFTLPVDAEGLAVLPHAHYLAREMQGWAMLPDGTKQWLLYIKNWDFNWQGDYRYAVPVFLPEGSTLHMRYTYDNSSANPRNPHHPPTRVTYGPRSSDEMAELWFELLPRNETGRATLADALQAKTATLLRESSEHRLGLNPNDASAHLSLGEVLLSQGHAQQAWQHFWTAAQLQPDSEQAHYFLGYILLGQKKLAEAKTQFAAALRLNPDNHKTHGYLGMILVDEGRPMEAEIHFRDALRLDPDDEIARSELEELVKARTKR